MEIEFLTLKQATDLLQFSARRVMDLWRAGKFPGAIGNDASTLRIPRTDLENMGQEPVVKRTDTGKSKAILEAEEAAQVAEYQERELKARITAEGYRLNMTAEQFIQAKQQLEQREENLEAVISERVEEEAEQLSQQIRATRAKEEAYLQRYETIGKENEDLRTRLDKALEEVTALRRIIGIKEEEEVKHKSGLDYYLEHYQDVITIARESAKYTHTLSAPMAASISNIMKKQLDYIEKATVEKWREKCYDGVTKACVNIMRGLDTLAGYYQDQGSPSLFSGLFGSKVDNVVITNRLLFLSRELENAIGVGVYEYEIQSNTELSFEQKKAMISLWNERVDN